MKKQKEFIYRCSACGHEEPKWLGRCPECGEWNTLIETAASGRTPGPGFGTRALPPQSMPLSSVDPLEGSRLGSGIPELDRVLGGGVMKRSAILVGGEPGIGKSTLLLQIAAAAETRGRVLYISGEESPGQIRMRADRLGLSARISRIELGCSGRLEDVSSLLDSVKPVIVLVDSAQTLYSTEAGLAPGTVNQMKYCSWELISWVKDHDAALFLTAHVTKEGLIAGPKTLEHMVDTVLYFEGVDAGDGESRFLRASKNRFGSVDEIGIFTMGVRGLIPVEDASRLFLVRREGDLPPGVAIAAVLEGSRCLLVEIQALTVSAKSGMSRVYSDRIDSGRVSRVAAALEKHLGVRLSDQDIYVNVAGGIRIAEVGVELALGCAIYSARTGLALPAGLAIAGELSLTGEIRPLRRMAGRLRSARGLGFPQFLGPASSEGPPESLEKGAFIPAPDIRAAVRDLFKAVPPPGKGKKLADF